MAMQHGGRRANQNGRPPLPVKKMRVGTLFLIPAAIKALTDLSNDGETLIQCAARVLTAHLESLAPEEPPPPTR